METTQRNGLLIAGGVILVALTVFLVYKFTNKAPEPISMAQKLHEARRYADSLGIDTARYVLPVSATKSPESETAAQAQLQKLLVELRYGHKPADQSFSGLKEEVDTAWVSNIMRKDSIATALKADAGTFAPYKALVQQYDLVRQTATPTQLKAIRESLNFYRYLNRFDFDKFVVVNIPAARLTVFDQKGGRAMPMDVIVGKADKQTPRFNCFLTDITAYPYWNVPECIVVKELLPKVQANPSFLDSQNMEVLDAKNKPVDPATLDWASFSADNFPYRFRQTSGCHNSLGLIKFVLNGPEAIYFHDTNARELFGVTKDRWRSHGCVRLEKPVEFANYVLGMPKFDQGFYDRCLVDQKPQTFKLPKPYPVFVTYHTADVDASGKLVFYKDVYRLESRLAAR
ncbi:MAG: L,D-transpeptidase family protein [Rudanella sp.]|nr:L,D-transpeptidase family protein [Rudanella sp.]